jgi:hypothetical protein
VLTFYIKSVIIYIKQTKRGIKMNEKKFEEIIKNLPENAFIDMGRYLDDLIKDQHIQEPLPDFQELTS